MTLCLCEYFVFVLCDDRRLRGADRGRLGIFEEVGVHQQLLDAICVQATHMSDHVPEKVAGASQLAIVVVSAQCPKPSWGAAFPTNGRGRASS